MQLFGKSAFEQREMNSRVMLALAAGTPSGFAQQAQLPNRAASDLPTAPAPVPTEPLNLRSTARDFSQPAGKWLGNPINMYRPTSIAKANFSNSVRLSDLVKDGKIYLSLSDALALALENNFDIAIARYNLDIADTDLLRAKAGSGLRGVNLDHDGGRRTGRNDRRLWRGGFGRIRPGAFDKRSGSCTGGSRPERHGNDSVGACHFGLHFAVHWWTQQHQHIRLHLQPGVRDGHEAGRGFKPIAGHFDQRLFEL